MCGTRCVSCGTQVRYSDGCRFYGYGDSGICDYEDRECGCISPAEIAKKTIEKNCIRITRPCEKCNDENSTMIWAIHGNDLVTCKGCDTVFDWGELISMKLKMTSAKQ